MTFLHYRNAAGFNLARNKRIIDKEHRADYLFVAFMRYEMKKIRWRDLQHQRNQRNLGLHKSFIIINLSLVCLI